MVSPWPGKPYTFRALRETFGPLFVRCDVCRRFVRLRLAGLQDTDYRTKTFSCSLCGGAGYLAIEDPTTESGMTDYRLDEREGVERHPATVSRLTRSPLRPPIANSTGELPGRSLAGRR